jgi:hypothetical protein
MRKIIFLYTVLCFTGQSVFSQNISFVGSTERAVVVGQQFRVNYTLTTGGENGKDINLPETKDFDNIFGPTLTNQGTYTTIVNGRASTQVTNVFTYILMAKSEGTFTIPPATIKVGNSEYKSNEISVKVLPPDQAVDAATANANAGNSGQQGAQSATSGGSSSEDIFLRAIVSKNSVYENEGFTIAFKLYTSLNPTGYAENPKFPEFDGFVSQEIDLPSDAQWGMDNLNGRNYRTVVLKQTVLFPQRAGKITIPSARMSMNVRVPAQRRQRSFFDDFLDLHDNVTRSFSSAPVTIDVKPLPEGKPASFSGAVGDFKMTSSISTNQMKTNDAVTVKVTISGNGNINYFKNPEIIFPNDFDKLDPQVARNIRVSASGVTGTRTIEYNAIPRYAGNFTIPKAEFTYFDLKSGTYKTLTTDEFSLIVEQGETGAGINMPVINASNKEDIRFLGKDIRYIKTESANFHKDDFFFGTLKYLLFYIIPTLLFLIFFWIYRKQAALNANIALVRTKKANKVASKRLKTAAKYLKASQTEAFYDEILKAVWGYLSDKLSIPVSALTKDNVDANLMKYGATENLIKDFRDILDTAEFARFAPAQAIGTMDDLYDATVQAIDKMENTIKK